MKVSKGNSDSLRAALNQRSMNSHTKNLQIDSSSPFIDIPVAESAKRDQKRSPLSLPINNQIRKIEEAW